MIVSNQCAKWKEVLEKLIKVSGEGLTTDEKQSIQDFFIVVAFLHCQSWNVVKLLR